MRTREEILKRIEGKRCEMNVIEAKLEDEYESKYRAPEVSRDLKEYRDDCQRIIHALEWTLGERESL